MTGSIADQTEYKGVFEKKQNSYYKDCSSKDKFCVSLV